MNDISNTPHVLCLGLDLEPALKNQIDATSDFIKNLENTVMRAGGVGKIKKSYANEIAKLSRVLNIKWISDALDNQIDITCTTSSACPRPVKCDGEKMKKNVSWINEIKKEIIKSTK